MRLEEFEPATQANEWLQTHALDRVVTGKQRWTLWRKINLNSYANRKWVDFYES